MKLTLLLYVSVLTALLLESTLAAKKAAKKAPAKMPNLDLRTMGGGRPMEPV